MIVIIMTNSFGVTTNTLSVYLVNLSLR